MSKHRLHVVLDIYVDDKAQARPAAAAVCQLAMLIAAGGVDVTLEHELQTAQTEEAPSAAATSDPKNTNVN